MTSWRIAWQPILTSRSSDVCSCQNALRKEYSGQWPTSTGDSRASTSSPAWSQPRGREVTPCQFLRLRSLPTRPASQNNRTNFQAYLRLGWRVSRGRRGENDRGWLSLLSRTFHYRSISPTKSSLLSPQIGKFSSFKKLVESKIISKSDRSLATVTGDNGDKVSMFLLVKYTTIL